MGDRNGGRTPKQRTARQYYYFYGSTDDGAATPASSSSPGEKESDSLVGESLVPTDNELEDLPHVTEGDFQQLLLVSGGGPNGGVHPLENGIYRKVHSRDRRRCRHCWSHFAEKRPLSYFALLVAFFSVIFLIIFWIVGGKMATSVSKLPDPAELTFKMKFEMVDRGKYGDPVSAFIDKSLFHPNLLYKKRSEGDPIQREFVFPFPTGAFWTNLVLPPTADQGLSYPVVVYPYAYKWSDKMLQVSYPANHRKEEPKAIHDYFFPDLKIQLIEEITSRHIQSFDALSVTLRLSTEDGHLETYLVQGSPYITLQYAKTTPVIRAFSIFTSVTCPPNDVKFGVCNSEDAADQTTWLQGVQFILQTQEGVSWMVFASEPITLRFDRVSKTTVTASDSFSGILRLAIIPPETTETSSTTTKPAPNQTSTMNNGPSTKSSGLQRLIYHAGVYPVSGRVSWSFGRAGTSDASVPSFSKTMTALAGSSAAKPGSSSKSAKQTGRIGTIEFKFETRTFAKTGSSATTPKPLLMLALPHHAQSLPESIQLGLDMFDLVYKCIKGPMRPILGTTWSYDEPLPSLGFDGDSGSSFSEKHFRAPGVRLTILKSLKQDVDLFKPTPTENIYGFGKQSARLAQLAHVASNLLPGNKTTDEHTEPNHEDKEIADILEYAKSTLRSSLERLLTSNVSDTLVYDANLGGMVTKDGLMNSEADFGNGRFNDHHFHYGYTLYACAVMGKLDSTFVDQYSDAVNALYYDVAYDANLDSGLSEGIFFPVARHKIWFDGHSFASGLFPFGNGKSQESSSEAVNCYYGAYLWSLVQHGAADNPEKDTSAQTDFARLLLATEIRGAKMYWHMKPPNSSSNQTDIATVYSPQLTKNYMIGNLGMLDATCSTWFGTESLYVHMINFIPVTAVTGELFDQAYVSEEYKKVIGPLEVEMAWLGYTISDHAIIDADAAWKEAQKLLSPSLDSAVSKSQVLYWISTRSGFNASSVHEDSDSKSGVTDSSGAYSIDSACSSHAACADAGLAGDCCPSSTGIFLSCCNR